MREIEIERLRHLLAYDPETGLFWWLVGRRGASRGKLAGCARSDGYCVLRIDGIRVLAHRAAWAIVHGEWPEAEVDHKNLNRADNRIENLRLASSTQNKANTRARSTNKAGLKGASFHRMTGKWAAQIQKDNATHFLGLFETAEQAHTAYCKAANLMHGEFARAA